MKCWMLRGRIHSVTTMKQHLAPSICLHRFRDKSKPEEGAEGSEGGFRSVNFFFFFKVQEALRYLRQANVWDKINKALASLLFALGHRY